MRWYRQPEDFRQCRKLRHTPRPASWNASEHPDQERLNAYLDDTEALVTNAGVEGPWALRLDIGAPPTKNLLTEVADLDNYAFPLASRLKDRDLVSVWCTKQHSEQSFVRIERACEEHEPATGVLVVRTTASTSTVAYKEQIHAAIARAAELPDGPVKLELSFVVGPRRNWLNLWKPTIDALDPLLGRTYPDRAWHPRDGRIIELGMHVSVDAAAGNDVTVGIAASRPEVEASDASSVLRAAAHANGWHVLIENGPYARDVYVLPDKGHGIEVWWGAAGVLMAVPFGDGSHSSDNAVWRHDDPWTKTERVLAALTNRRAEFPPAPEYDEPLIDRIRRHIDLRSEIEQVLINHPRTRYAKVLIGMRAGLSDAEMAEESVKAGEPINGESVAAVRRLVRLSLNDELAPAPSDAAAQAGLYRELLNYARSPELTQHISTKLAKLRELDPKIPLTPLGHVHLGANDQSKLEEPEDPCPDCFLVHAGECL
jgi:hypothetical protein